MASAGRPRLISAFPQSTYPWTLSGWWTSPCWHTSAARAFSPCSTSTRASSTKRVEVGSVARSCSYRSTKDSGIVRYDEGYHAPPPRLAPPRCRRMSRRGRHAGEAQEHLRGLRAEGALGRVLGGGTAGGPGAAQPVPCGTEP